MRIKKIGGAKSKFLGSKVAFCVVVWETIDCLLGNQTSASRFLAFHPRTINGFVQAFPDMSAINQS